MVRVDRGLARAFAVVISVVAGTNAGMAQAVDGPAGAVPNPPEAAQAPAVQTPPVERRIALKHHWTREEVNVVYRIGDSYQPEAMTAINHLLRDWRCQKETQIDPKLVDLLHALQQELGSGPIRVVSAYRSEGYNASLLRAGRTVDPDSQHTLGRAADVIFPGVKPDRVRQVAEAHGIGGVGYYPFSGPVFVHVDTGPVRHWVETDPKERRAMGLALGRRSRFVLDCALTTEKVFQEISAERAYAALPQGASARPNPGADVLRTALAAGSAAFAPLSRLHVQNSGGIASIQADDGPACYGWDPLSRLSLLPPEIARPVPFRPASLKRQASGRQKAKVKAQLQTARRQAKTPRREAAAAGRSRKR